MSMDEINKIAGAAIAALLVFLLLGFFSGKIFHAGEQGAHHGEETLAFALDTGEEEVAEPEEEISLAQLASTADAARGEKVFNKCKACHKIEDGSNGVGPHLWNVVGREIGSVGGYGYSGALGGMDGTWDVAALDGFLESPSGWAPGTAMGYAGLKDAADRMAVIAYLNEAGDAPIDLIESAGGLEEAAAVEDSTEDVAAADTEATAEEATEEAVPEDASATEAAASEEAVEEETAATEDTVETTAEAVTEEAATEGAATEEAATEEAATEEASAEQASEEATVESTEVAVAAPAEAENAPEAEAATEEASPFASLLAAADAANGKKIFRKCQACHKVEEGKNGVGPSLWGVVGRDIGSAEGYRYSKALAGMDGTWTLSGLDGFLTNPRKWAPGTKMVYQGLRDPQDRIDVITYLNEADGTPSDLASE
ncbi:MAG: c-type cytochrome [Pseudomonadota bacterium]